MNLSRPPRRCLHLLALSALILSTCANAQLTTLLSFDGANGATPWSTLVQGVDGHFYGTTAYGGQYGGGTVFKITPQGTLTTLHSFSFESGGAVPHVGLTLASDGSFYGTTQEPPGTIFRITTNGVHTLLFSFNVTNGERPWNGPLIEASDGFLYGMTPLGGKFSPTLGLGTVYRISLSGAFTGLYSFDGRDGSAPYGGLVQGSDGEFYGMTSQGGEGLGNVFKITSQGSLTPLVSFDGINGAVPFSALLKGADGNFYGTTIQGGDSYGNTNSVNGRGFGTIFKMTPDGALTTLFSFQRTNGEYPYATLVQGSDGDFYGTTLSGGASTNELFPGSPGYIGNGTIFRFSTNGTLTTLASFDGTNGAQTFATLTLDGHGNFYGTTVKGGAHDGGTIFRLSLSSPPLTINCSGPATAQCSQPVSLTAVVNGSVGASSTVAWSVNGIVVQRTTIQPGGSTSVSLVLPKGTNLVTAAVIGTAAFCSSTLTVIDSKPPEILRANASPNILWPPNGRMVTVTISAAVADDCSSASWKVIGVRSNEPVDSRGAARRSPDWKILDDHTVSLRAERSGNGAGRAYEIEIQASDASSNLSQTKVVTVRVPKTYAR